MKRIKSAIVMFLICAMLITLTACGGGDDDIIGTSSSTDTGTTDTGTSSSTTLSGTAATGKALVNVPVYLKDSTGEVVDKKLTDDNGKFSFDTSNYTPPFYLRTQGYELFSFTSQKSGTANLTPLSTAVVAVANNGNPDIFTNPPSSQLDLETASQELKEFLAPVMEKYGVPDNADFISTPFEADGQDLDAVLDSIYISIDSADSANVIIEIKNPFTGETIGTGILSGGVIGESDYIDPTEVNSLPQTVTHKKYFSSDDPQHPAMIDIVEDENGNLSVTMTTTEGDTGGLFLVYGYGTRSDNEISFTLPIILCNDTDPNGTGTAEFNGTIDSSSGNISGTFENTLSEGDTCKETGTNTFTGTFSAEDVTDQSPADMSGTYDFYFTPDECTEEGPVTFNITQNSNIIDVSFNADNVDYSGKGIIYGNYIVFRVPVILCHDTDANAEAEYATFFGKFDSQTKAIVGGYGDGVPPGDYCKTLDYDTTQETSEPYGTWVATLTN